MTFNSHAALTDGYNRASLTLYRIDISSVSGQTRSEVKRFKMGSNSAVLSLIQRALVEITSPLIDIIHPTWPEFSAFSHPLQPVDRSSFPFPGRPAISNLEAGTETSRD